MPLYKLSDDAENDLAEITEYTYENHGATQTLKYINKLSECASKLATDDGNYKKLSEIHPQLRITHCQHHYIFGVMRSSRPMLVVAILHERMKLIERVKKSLK